MHRPLLAGNWKMNGSLASSQALVQALLQGVRAAGDAFPCELAVCPPMAHLAPVAGWLQGQDIVVLGAQDVSQHEVGAHTGEVSAAMLAELGVRYCIVGHSERRQQHGETDLDVAQKASRALAAGLTPIVCVGETLQQREQGLAEFIVQWQLAAVLACNRGRAEDLVVAYEPVWAIGTGHTASAAQAQAIHQALRQELARHGAAAERVRIVYGGSMKPGNAASLLAQPDVNGGLVGGAALVAADFLRIAAAAS